ncbi:MAG: pilus assembly protein N-terminal domain-containing protein, partial [Chromatiales bacterium]|nr:pilus assembly protein N-terminal domain-containing protein [Chromatiales bacterium]
AAAGAGSAASRARSPLSPDRAAGESGSTAPGSDTGTPRSRTVASPPGPDSRTGAPGLESPDPAPPPVVSLILGQSRRIHLAHDATTILVAAPEVADVQLLAPDVLYVIGKGIGRTSVTVLQDDERIEERVIAVALDLEPLRTVLAGESDLTGVRVRRLSRGAALTGEVASAASVDRALRLAAGVLPEGVPIENELRVAAPQQVNLEVQIAEVHRAVTEDLGVNWEVFRVRGDGEGSVGFRIGRIIDGFPRTEFEGRLASSVGFERIGSHSRLGAMVDALATAGLANVLARPNVTAVSGESASFFSGGERPIPSGYDSRTDTILIEYMMVGLVLDFVPTVVDSGRIVLTVRPEVSEPDASQPLVIGPVQLPIINVRRAETTVEVGDGESIVIAGLFRNRSSTTEAGLPGLKDVPLLGLLFGTTSIRSNELELIVIVTARLVRPNAAPGETDPPPATLRVSGYHY